MSKKLSSQEKFHSFYQKTFSSRWNALQNSLLEDKKFVALENPFFNGKRELREKWSAYQGATILKRPTEPETDSEERKEFYPLDGASLMAVLALDLQGGEKVLDMCAAPGGKSLAISFLLNSGELISNDLSLDRRRRMQRVFDSYLPRERHAKITGFDASLWGTKQSNVFDKVLLDAPCSSERHVLEKPQELAKWSEKRSKGLAVRQFALLASALEVVKPGGLIVYSTCALSPLENDEVIRKLFKKRSGQFVIEENSQLEWGEKTEFGYHFLPDQCEWGPIYCSIIRKE